MEANERAAIGRHRRVDELDEERVGAASNFEEVELLAATIVDGDSDLAPAGEGAADDAGPGEQPVGLDGEGLGFEIGACDSHCDFGSIDDRVAELVFGDDDDHRRRVVRCFDRARPEEEVERVDGGAWDELDGRVAGAVSGQRGQRDDSGGRAFGGLDFELSDAAVHDGVKSFMRVTGFDEQGHDVAVVNLASHADVVALADAEGPWCDDREFVGGDGDEWFRGRWCPAAESHDAEECDQDE